ncbi:MAG: HEAT repeat domain-containing protein [Gemmataceae bacterium]
MRFWKWWLPLAAVVLVVVAACCFPLLRSFYLLRGLRTADESTRASWAWAVAQLGPSAIEPLLAGLDNPAEADSCAAALQEMAAHHIVPPSGLAEAIARVYARQSPEGRSRGTQLVAQWIQAYPEDASLHASAVALLPICAQVESSDQWEAVLHLTLGVISRPCDAGTLAIARSLAQRGLSAESVPARVRAVTLCMQPALDLLPPLVPLLRDPAPEVRRAVVLALGPNPEAISDEALLTCLHDSDQQVRQTASSALIARGLQPEQVEMGRLLTHAQVRMRLQVLDRLPEVPDVDPLVWLSRLSEDRSPAVRAAAARALAGLPVSSGSDRLQEMARSDPSPTVARIAQYYLAQRNRLRPASAP